MSSNTAIGTDAHRPSFASPRSSRMSEDSRRKNDVDPEKIRADVAKRISSAYVHFRLSREEARQAAQLLHDHVLQAVAVAAGIK